MEARKFTPEKDELTSKNRENQSDPPPFQNGAKEYQSQKVLGLCSRLN